MLIAGPTASGKSALAIALALEEGGVIVNADAMQVYRDLRILTARPSEEDESQVPHRLYGHVPGASAYSVARWLADASAEIDAVWRSGRVPVIVGGTGLYFKALEQGLADIPLIPPDITEKWRAAKGDLHAELAKRDKGAAARLNPNDRQRIIRAIEVFEGTGKPLDHWQRAAQGSAVLAGVEARRIFLNPDRKTLHARANARFERMVKEGGIEEARSLLEQGLGPNMPVMKAIGVKQMAAYLAGQTPLEEAVKAGQTATRQYIKRQLTWWRHQMPGWEERRA
ncbi:tRNA (adenosine(37)-N6)-dimethylallyltransferase MiaA [Taklimakanibacter lacteus]|uniref:tRNA (adenosine(37)-N6)-dimethylallyltransferase MiaA n=1 Tax=Taklimakanibacter lacteus TaxID=2268456 RepID=UPI0034D7A8FD